MYMKGADSIMFPRMIIDKPQLEKLEEDLSIFAKKGLRTLVMCKKILPKETYEQWKIKFDKVNTSNDLDKEDQLALLYDELEYGFTYLG
mmetsp:Transcript_32666/g.37294  ORF Transcript_32666/g.37294 Transcript_32666/m.37294 type:complete len:89 (+) Transcript_32666:57-323(+)